MDMQATLTEINSLSIDDRIDLVQAIWDGIAADQGQISLNDAEKAELDRRIAEDDAHPEDVVPWEQVLAAAQNRLKR